MDGNSRPGKPIGKANTGKPRPMASEAARKEPRDTEEAKNTTSPVEACVTTADVRAARRAGRGTEAGPPAHHTTAPPVAAKRPTADAAEPRQEPAKPGPGPNAAKQRTAEGGRPADSTAASAPTAHPTAKDRPDASTDRHTAATRAEACGGRARDPATATTPPKLTGTAEHPGQTGERPEQATGHSHRDPARKAHLDRERGHRETDRRPDRRTGGAKPGHGTPAETGPDQAGEQPGGGGRADRNEQTGRRRMPTGTGRQRAARPHQAPARDNARNDTRAAAGTHDRDETRSDHKTPHEGRQLGGDAPHRANRPPPSPAGDTPKERKTGKKRENAFEQRPAKRPCQGGAPHWTNDLDRAFLPGILLAFSLFSGFSWGTPHSLLPQANQNKGFLPYGALRYSAGRLSWACGIHGAGRAKPACTQAGVANPGYSCWHPR
jgi:hypothetical protein